MNRTASRRRPLQCSALLTLFATASAAVAQSPGIRPTTHVFVDDHLIATKSGVRRTIHPCRKLPRPVVEPEKPWEGGRVYVYGTVHYDAASKQYRMWYMSCPPAGKRDKALQRTSRALVLYATSRDGVHWVKPELGLYEYGGSKANNILYGLDSPSVLVDVSDPDPARRYKMLGRGRTKNQSGGWGVRSADGLHWQDAPGNPGFKTSDTLTLAFDPKTREYLAFHKLGTKIRGYSRRTVHLRTSKDFRTWSPSKLVMAPDEKDDAWAKRDPQRTEFYNMSVFPYAGQFLGLVTVFRLERHLKKTVAHQSAHDGPIHAQLVHSRDGRTWHRLDDRTPVIPNGPDDYDAGCILGVTNTPVICGDEMWLYYTAITTGHGGAMPAKRITIGRAAWRLDGLVSLDAGDQGGVVETVPVRMTGDRLVVNADAANGSLTVELLDENGRPLAGYAAAECVPIRSDAVRHVVQWKGQARPETRRPVRLRFRLRGAKLYAFSSTGPTGG